MFDNLPIITEEQISALTPSDIPRNEEELVLMLGKLRERNFFLFRYVTTTIDVMLETLMLIPGVKKIKSEGRHEFRRYMVWAMLYCLRLVDDALARE